MSEVWGITDNLAIHAFADMVQDNRRPGMIIVEVGVWRGKTAMLWLPIIKVEGGRGILIDHFKGSPNEHPLPGTGCPWDPAKADRRCLDLSDRIIASGLGDTAEIWQASSARAARELADESCDIIFIDADHRYSAVRQDIASYRNKVRPGGILCGHDVHSLADAWELPPETWEVDVPPDGPYKGRHCGVDRAVWEAFGTEGVEILAGNVWVRRVPV